MIWLDKNDAKRVRWRWNVRPQERKPTVELKNTFLVEYHEGKFTEE